MPAPVPAPAPPNRGDAPAPTRPPYAYPLANPDAVRLLGMLPHPEGGFYVETDRQSEEVASPFADGEPRSLATSIFYLLTPDASDGVFHMNKSATMHVLHHGRAEYTLIHPGSPPRIETVVMGTDLAAGERMQLMVGSGIWKKSRLPPADVACTDSAHTGCLITEVVFPGFHWTDHAFLTREALREMWGGHAGWEVWLPWVRKE